ncbi:MAG: selenocysteine-specific elongation factor [Myxococcota bacterium]
MIIIGTAGHIDHGKTSLVGALTGIVTDRLKEEQERGISIELGFAYMDLESGERCGLVDVPGHERFVRQMIAGATGIDVVLLVIAADEGVMQQTREHLDICRLLGIKRGIVVLTKVDLVDEEWLELVESDVMDFVEGSFLEGAPVVHFSAPDKSTHGGMRREIELAAAAITADGKVASDRPLRLPIDRVFTMRGFGTVITGTVCSGELALNDTLEILPNGLSAKVRGIQSHGDPVKDVSSGQRGAINLQGIDRDAIARGDVVTHAKQLVTTRMLDVDLTLLKHVPRPLESQAKVLVHVGTSQVNGTVVLLDEPELAPGDTAPAQLRLDQYVVALGGDHVVLRGFDLLPTYGKTLAGGIIRHPCPRKHKRGDPTVLDAFEALRDDDLQARCEHVVRLEGQAGISPAMIRQTVNDSKKAVDQILQTLVETGRLYRYTHEGNAQFVHCDPFDELMGRARAVLTDYHAQYAHRSGIPRGELRSRIRADLPSKYFAAIAGELVKRNVIETADTTIRLAGFTPTLTEELKAVRAALHARFRASGMEPPLQNDLVAELSEQHGLDSADVTEMIGHLVADGFVERVSETLVFATEHIDSLMAMVTDFLNTQEEMTTPQLKELTGASRKYTVPLGEHLDARKVTIRVGDARKLRKS